MKPLSQTEKKIIKHIKNFDTPTISNSLELIDSSLRSKGHTQKTMHCLNPKLKPIVGFAKTAIITSRKKKSTNIIQNRDKYYEYMFDGSYPKICVIEDKDNKNTIGAWWGELNAKIHSNFGFEGAITNGAMRDLQEIDKTFQILSGEIRVGHGYNQIHKLNCKVNIFNMVVQPNDIIHADLHGAVNINRNYLKELPSAIKKMVNKEKIIISFLKKNKKFSKKQFIDKYKKFLNKK